MTSSGVQTTARCLLSGAAGGALAFDTAGETTRTLGGVPGLSYRVCRMKSVTAATPVT
jgi:hypothetical protein